MEYCKNLRSVYSRKKLLSQSTRIKKLCISMNNGQQCAAISHLWAGWYSTPPEYSINSGRGHGQLQLGSRLRDKISPRCFSNVENVMKLNFPCSSNCTKVRSQVTDESEYFSERDDEWIPTYEGYEGPFPVRFILQVSIDNQLTTNDHEMVRELENGWYFWNSNLMLDRIPFSSALFCKYHCQAQWNYSVQTRIYSPYLVVYS